MSQKSGLQVYGLALHQRALTATRDARARRLVCPAELAADVPPGQGRALPRFSRRGLSIA